MVMVMLPPEDAPRRPSSRLPVNPRRHKVAPEQRKRVATACNGCNVRRVKCSGDTPCQQCLAAQRECVYPVAVDKVSLSRSDLDDLRLKLDAYERALSETVPDPARRQELLQQFVSSPASSTSAGGPFPSTTTLQATPSSSSQAGEATPPFKTEPPDDEQQQQQQPLMEERLLRDGNGRRRVFGETSEAAFLDHLKEFAATALPLAPSSPQQQQQHDGGGRAFASTMGRFRSSDAQPLHSLDVDPLWLPPPETLSAMLVELRYLIQDGNGAWPSGGIHYWGDLSSVAAAQPSSSSHALDADGDDEPEPVLPSHHLAFYQAALAVLCQSTVSRPATAATLASPHPSEASLARAAELLGDCPLDPSRCTAGDAATLALLAWYHLERNRREAAGVYAALAARVAVMHGAHRGWVGEAGKRVFWTVYVLDRWLSCLMGRPPNIADDAIRLSLPADVPSLPPAAGLAAHVELHRISGYLVSTTSSTSSSAGDESPSNVLWMLDQWLSSLPASLKLSREGLSDDPAACLLHMGRNELIILALRPLFLAAVKRLFADQHSLLQPARPSSSSTTTTEMQSSSSSMHHLSSSVAAAQRIVRLVRHAMSLSRRRKLLHMGLHHLSTAAVCLQLYELVAGPIATSTSSGSSADIDFAMQTFATEAGAGNPYARDCAETLHNLSLLVSRLRAPVDPRLSAAAAAAMGHEVMDTDERGQGAGGAPGGPELYDELMSWVGNNDFSMFDGGSGFLQ